MATAEAATREGEFRNVDTSSEGVACDLAAAVENFEEDNDETPTVDVKYGCGRNMSKCGRVAAGCTEAWWWE